MRKVYFLIGMIGLFGVLCSAQSEQEKAYTDLVTKYFEYYEADKPDSAEIVLVEALRLMPQADGNFLLRGNLAELMVARGDTLSAIEQLSLAIGEQPQVTRLRSRRAMLLEDVGKYHDALYDLDQLILQEPSWEIPLFNRARVKQKMGLLEGARHDLEKIIELNDNAYLPRVALANLLEDMGDLDGAERILTYLMDAYPKVPNAYRERAMLRLRQGRKAAALEDIRYVFNELKIETSEDYRIRGEIWKRYGENEQAEKDFQKAREL